MTETYPGKEFLTMSAQDNENPVKSNDNAKKQVLLRLAPSLWNKIAAWAEDDFRSINGQIEYLLSEAVKNRYKSD